MTTKTIKRGRSGFTIKTSRPHEWPQSSTVTLDIVNMQGSVIESDVAVSTYTGDTVDGDTVAGSFDVVLVTGNSINAGERVTIGSDTQGHQERVVEKYDSDTNTLTLTTCLDDDVDDGSLINGMYLTATIDASTDDYTNIREVQAIWKTDSDGITMKEVWRVLSSENQPSGFITDFVNAYSNIADSVNDVPVLYRRAEQVQISYFRTRQRDYKLIADNEIAKEALMAKMALLAANGAQLSEENYARIEKYYQDQMDILDNLDIWIDENENDVVDEGETEKAQQYAIARGL